LKEIGMIDLTSEFGARVARRLEKEPIIWMTTIGPDGTPQPVPVWFLWIDEAFLIYSRPDKPKLRNIQHNPKVALNFDGDGGGGDIIVFNGEAAIDPHAPPSNELPAYQEKYRERIAGIGMTPETFARGYSVAVRVKPTKIRGH
jgi:PPOX class probable F420-dependent enzyme